MTALRTLLILVAVVVLAAVPWFGSDVVVQFGISTLLLAVLAQGWNIIGGYAGYASFGNSTFFGLGAYGVAIAMVQWNMPFWVGMIFGAVMAVAFAFLWLATLWWGLHRTTPAAGIQVEAKPKTDAVRAAKPALAQALAKGDPEAISAALCSAADAGDLDGVREKLDDPAQQAAVDALQRARWGDGDVASALAALRSAFKRGPRPTT